MGRRRSGHRWYAGCVAALMLGAVAACGGGSSSSPSDHATTQSPGPTDSQPPTDVPTQRPDSLSPAGGPVPQQFEPVAVSFVSDSVGWVLGSAPCSLPPCTSIVRTVDRGKSWVGIPAPRAEKPLTIAFANSRVGYVLTGNLPSQSDSPRGHKLFVTRDGGERWSAMDVRGGYPVAVATNGTQVFVVAAPTNGSKLLLDGPVDGTSLQTLGSVDGEGLTVQGNYAYVYPPGVEGEVAGRPALYVWDGSHIAQHALPCTNDWFNALAASAATDLALICGGQPGAGQEEKTVFTSANAGSRWTHVPPPTSSGYVGSATATTRGTFYTGARSAIVYTRDAGQHWQLTQTHDADSNGFLYIGFTDPEHGVAIPGGHPYRLLLTDDAGENWYAVYFRG